jgi:hypothetical protein
LFDVSSGEIQKMKLLSSRLLRRLFLLGVSLVASPQLVFPQSVPLTFEQPQTAGISGFRNMWDTPIVLEEGGPTEVVDKPRGKAPSAQWFPEDKKRQGPNATLLPGALAFDAVHRSLLVRFPGSAERIAEQLALGHSISKAEILLPYRDTEMWPEGYQDQDSVFLKDMWVKYAPQWHAVAWMLRKPWTADAKTGPTYNAYINGAGYWAKFGAQDEKKDRFPTQFGPAAVSSAANEPLDVTQALTDASFGKSIEERLRRFEYCGFLVRKWETYDQRYNQGDYEWGVATGARAILINTPRLSVTFTKNAGVVPTIQKRELQIDMAALTENLRKNKTGGAPTAVMPTTAQIKKSATKCGFNQPSWMPDWQWKRVSELHALGGFETMPDTPEAYTKWIDEMLAIIPRHWSGFDAPELTQTYFLYSSAWPAPVRAHWKEYWKAWLMPERETKTFVHAQSYVADVWNQESVLKYYDRTKDWRGNSSFYRWSYTYNMSTSGFNHIAATGALLGGAIIGSERAMADGRHGLENFPLRLWSWYDGTMQQAIDHYYFAFDLKSQKAFADFGPTQLDRMMGRTMLAKSVEELTSSYHPQLHRFIATSLRTGLAYVFTIQDGTQHIMHALSHKGALTDIGNKSTPGNMPVLGQAAKPGAIAQQTLNGPWIPGWATYMVDEKPLPYQMTNTCKMWGGYATTPLWKRSYLGNHYGVASIDVDQGNAVPAMAQWQRNEASVQRSEELSTLLVRPGYNKTNLVDSLFHGTNEQNPNGVLVPGGAGGMYTLQDKGKMIVLTSPWNKNRYPSNEIAPFKSLQTTIGLFDFQKSPTWELFVDGRKITSFPEQVKAGQRITIHDGISYVGIIPLPSTDLGRTSEVLITDDTGPMIKMQGGGEAKPSLLIEQYNYKSDTPLGENADLKKIDQAYGGFVIEVADATEFPTFAAFQQHMDTAKLDTQWDAAKIQLDISYKSGSDLVEAGFRPEYSSGNTDQLFPYRKVNGAWPYNPPGIERDSTLTMQGSTGKLEKNGATLISEPGHMAYLQTELNTGTYAGFNPFPDPISWSMSTPGGISVTANGKLGLARVVVRPKDNKVWIDYALRDDQETLAGMASAFLLSGFSKAPTVELNGVPIKTKWRKESGRNIYEVSLSEVTANPVPAKTAANMGKGRLVPR